MICLFMEAIQKGLRVDILSLGLLILDIRFEKFGLESLVRFQFVFVQMWVLQQGLGDPTGLNRIQKAANGAPMELQWGEMEK